MPITLWNVIFRNMLLFWLILMSHSFILPFLCYYDLSTSTISVHKNIHWLDEYITKHPSHLIIIIIIYSTIPKINLTHSSFQIRGGAKWSMDSFDGVNVEMLDCHKGSQWRVLRRRILRDCMMTFMCPREGTIRWYLSSYLEATLLWCVEGVWGGVESSKERSNIGAPQWKRQNTMNSLG